MCLLTGAPGMGKTHLARQFVRTLPSHAAALDGRGFKGTPPLFPVSHALHALLSSAKGGVAETARRYASGVPVLQEALDWPKPSKKRAGARFRTPLPAEAIPTETYTFFALADVFRQLSAERPTVLFLDDVQWLDVQSVGFLDFLVQERLPLLLLLSARTNGHEPPVLSELRAALSRAERTMRRYELQPLSLQEIDAGAERFLGRRLECTEVELDWLRRTSKGIPKYLEEVLAILREEGMFLESGEKLRFRQPPESLRVPPTLRELTWKRLDAVAADAPVLERLVEYAAVSGPRFDARVIARPTGVSIPDAAACLQRLAARTGFVRRVGRTTEWEFDHELTREAVLDRVGDVAKDLHHQIATVLAAAPDHDPNIVAQHFRAAGDWIPAARSYQQAAENAHERFMFTAAAGAARLAEQMLQQAGPEAAPEQLAVSELLGRSLVAAQQYPQAIDIIERAVPGDRLREHPRMAHSLARAKLNLPERRSHEEAVEILRDALEHAGRHQSADATDVLTLEVELILAYDSTGQHERSQARLRQALARAQAAGAVPWVIRLLRLHCIFSQPETVVAATERAVELARRSHSRVEEALCYNNLGTQYWYLCQLDRAESYWKSAEAILEELGGYRKDVPRNNLGLLALAAGRHDQAAEDFAQALRCSLDLDDRLLIRTNAAVAEAMAGRLDAARRALADLAHEADRWGDTFFQDCIRYNLARVLLLMGQARQSIEAVTACPPRHWLTDEALVLGKRAALLIEAHAALREPLPGEEWVAQRNNLMINKKKQVWLYQLPWELCDIQFWQD